MPKDGQGSYLRVSILSFLRRVDMFSKKKFIFNGKARQKISPSPSPPEPALTELSSHVNHSQTVDFSRFNFMGIEEFLSNQMEKSESNNCSSALSKASGILSAQLKGSRAILSLRSYLSSIDGTISALDRLMDTAYFIISAENFYLLQLDSDGVDLVITHTQTDGAIGLRIPVGDITSGRITIILSYPTTSKNGNNHS